MINLLLLIAWGISGSFSFWFWYTKDFNLTLGDLPLLLLTAIPGPLCWLVGWLVHGNKPAWFSIVLFRKR